MDTILLIGMLLSSASPSASPSPDPRDYLIIALTLGLLALAWVNHLLHARCERHVLELEERRIADMLTTVRAAEALADAANELRRLYEDDRS